MAKTRYPVSSHYDLSVKYEIPFKIEDGELNVPGLEVQGVARNVSYLGLEIKTQAELIVNEIEQARFIDTRELPVLVKKDASSPVVYAVRSVEQPFTLSFKVKKYDRLDLDPASADRIDFTHVISPEGKVVALVQMLVRNSRQQFATLTLNNGAKILSAFLDDESVKPSIAEDNTYLLPLKRQADKPFTLEVVYEDKDLKLNQWGGLAQMTYPKINLAASAVTANVFVPDRYKFSSPRGSFREMKVNGFVPWFKGGSEDLSSGGHFLQNDQGQKIGPAKALLSPVLQTSAKTETASGGISGTLPLRIEIPKKGTKVTARSFFVPASLPLTMRFLFCSRPLYQAAFALVLFLLVLMGYLFPGLKDKSYARQSLRTVLVLILLVITPPLPWEQTLLCFAAGLLFSFLRKNPKPRQAMA